MWLYGYVAMWPLIDQIMAVINRFMWFSVARILLLVFCGTNLIVPPPPPPPLLAYTYPTHAPPPPQSWLIPTPRPPQPTNGSSKPSRVVRRTDWGSWGKIGKTNLGDVWQFVGLLLWKICLNNRFQSSGELFGSILV